MPIDELLILVGRRLKILQKLNTKKYYVSELANEFEKFVPEISVNLKELEKNGLVMSEEEEGTRRKYYQLSEYGEWVLRIISWLTQKNREGKIENWQIEEIINILNDPCLSLDLRKSYSNTFHSVCSGFPMEVVSSQKALILFEEVIANPFRDDITRDLMRSVSTILPHALRARKTTRRWVLEKLHPLFMKSLDGKNQDVRVWALKKIGVIAASEPRKETEALEMLIRMWFSDDINPESAFGREMMQLLVNLAPRHTSKLFEDVKTRAKESNSKIKIKAELLLEQLKTCLLPPNRRKSEISGTFA